MLYETDLCNAPDGSSVRAFSEMVNDQFILRMPQQGRSKLREGLKRFFPDANAFLENSTIYTEDGQKCIQISQAAEFLGISEQELTDALIEKGIGEYVLTEEQTHTLQ